MEGVKIGNRAIISTKSLVTKDIEPYSGNVEITEKRLKYRFDNYEMEKLLEIE